jgi:hypothetical protein
MWYKQKQSGNAAPEKHDRAPACGAIRLCGLPLPFPGLQPSF